MITRFWDWVDSRAVMRRGVLLVVLWMTYEITVQAWLFARASTFDGLGTAAVIGAVTAPFAALLPLVFNSYVKGRQ